MKKSTGGKMRVCEICGKKKMSGHQISHSNRKTKRKFYPNIFEKKILIDGKFKKIKICAKCLKKMGKAKN